jgi:hypothetical protein
MAELAHKRHTKTQELYDASAADNLFVAKVRAHFLHTLFELRPDLYFELKRVAVRPDDRYRDHWLSNSAASELARRYGIRWKGKPAYWLCDLDWLHGRHNWDRDQEFETRIVLPTFPYNPLHETRASFLARITEAVQVIADEQCRAMEQAAIARNARRYPATFPIKAHFEWLARYQVLGEPKKTIADPLQADLPAGSRRRRYRDADRAVYEATRDIARLLPMDLRKEKIGRPRTQKSISHK